MYQQKRLRKLQLLLRNETINVVYGHNFFLVIETRRKVKIMRKLTSDIETNSSDIGFANTRVS